MIKSRLSKVRDGKKSGMSIEELIGLITKADRSKWRPSERAVDLADWVEIVEKVYGKRARKKLEDAL